jgi:hypothetical protein
VKQGYRIAIAREPDEEELRTAIEFLSAQEKSYAASAATASSESRHRALADFCQVLFGLNEFVYVE